jgi:hypothetical protein
VKALVHLSDDALPAPLFERVRKAVVGLGEQRLRATYQTTFWFDFDASPSNVIEEAIASLRPRARRKFTGAEWWLSRMRTSNVQVDFHRDRDERLAQRGGAQVHPAISSVLFLNTCRGGLLAVTREAPNPNNPAMAPDTLALDLVKPAPNRYVWFDGGLTHGVLDAHNQIPGQRLRREAKLRLTVAINFWKRRPTGIPRFADRRIYSQLAVLQCGSGGKRSS